MKMLNLFLLLCIAPHLQATGAIPTIIKKVFLGGAIRDAKSHHGEIHEAIIATDVERVYHALSALLPLTEAEASELLELAYKVLLDKKRGLYYCGFLAGGGALITLTSALKLNRSGSLLKPFKLIRSLFGGAFGMYLAYSSGTVFHTFYHEYQNARTIVDTIQRKTPVHTVSRV